MQNTDVRTSQLCKEDLDAYLYPSIEKLAKAEYPPVFTRVEDLLVNRNGVDVLLEEGPYRTNIAEFGSGAQNAPSFMFEVSHIRNGITEAGWFLDSSRPTHFYILYFPEPVPDPDGIALRALMVSRTKLLAALDAMGCNRMFLATREEVIREAGKQGVYQTANPSLGLHLNARSEFQPVSLVVQTSLLAKIATADVHVVHNKEKTSVSGYWVNTVIQQ